jgi:hypothetical protein
MANSADYSQRTADGPEDDDAERITQTIERQNPQWAMWHDPEKRRDFVDGLRDALSGQSKDTTAEEDARLRQESPEEKPWNQDEFFNNPEEMKKYGRPQKL